MKFKNKRVLVIGAGVSGLSSVKFFVERGAKVTVYDDNRMPRYETTLDNGAVYEFEIDNLLEEDFDLAILSPGVSINHVLAKRFATKLTNDMTIGLSGRHKRVVAVTGTNGKTSVVNLINDAINSQKGLFKRKSVLCGNSGTPVTSVVRELRRKDAVVEVSSFMLETSVMSREIRQMHRLKFRPNIAVILNVTQDHLERHGTIENYIAHKAEITAHQKKRDVLILNYDDEVVRQMAFQTKARVLYFSRTARVHGVYVEGDDIFINLGGKAKARKIGNLGKLGLVATHDIMNFLAMSLVVKLLGCGDNVISAPKKIDDHRIQYIETVGNVAFYNDSKATNVSACLAAVGTFELPICLLVGGQPKSQEFKSLFEKLPSNVVRVFAFGEAREQMESNASEVGFERLDCFETMEEAFREAVMHSGDTRIILLSPACASFDQFRGYADRGNVFKNLVKEHAERS